MIADSELALTRAREAVRMASAGAPDLRSQRRREAVTCQARARRTPHGVVTLGGVECLAVGPPGRPKAVFVHGGGFVAGAPELVLGLVEQLTLRTGWQFVMPRYRLAPEFAYPAARDDVVAVLTAVDRPVHLIGQSAGGTLALSAAQRLAAGGTTAPLLSLTLISPWLDLRGRRLSNSAGDPGVDAVSLRRCAASYLGACLPSDPGASPGLASMGGLPRTLLQVGGAELLAPQARDAYASMRAAGVEADLRTWPKMFHNWQFFYEHLAPASAALDEIASWLQASDNGSPLREEVEEAL